MEKFTYDFSKDFKKVFENLTSGHYEEDVQFLKVPVRTGKTYSCEQYMIKFLERVKNDEDLLRKIVIFTTEKNILADGTYMNVLEGVKKDSNLILFKQELYEKSNETDSQLTFKDFILKEWLSKNESSLFGAGGKRPRKPRLGISVERTVYNNKTINRLKSTLTSSEQKIYKKRMQKILKKLRLN